MTKVTVKVDAVEMLMYQKKRTSSCVANSDEKVIAATMAGRTLILRQQIEKLKNDLPEAGNGWVSFEIERCKRSRP